MNNKNEADFVTDDANKAGSVLLDLYLELFGIFIPGFILVSGLIALISLRHYCIYDQVSFCSRWFSEMNFSHSFFFVLIMSYAIGAILHREKPDIPDERSAISDYCDKIKKWSNYNGAVNFPQLDKITLFFISLFPNLLKKYKFIKYPYKNLRGYLINHNLHHLLKFVPWCKYSECNGSRTIINELKTIVKYYGNRNFISELTRLESNVRMFTSLWYTFKYLIIIALCCLGLIMILSVVTYCEYVKISNAETKTLLNYIQDVRNLHASCQMLIFILIIIVLWKARTGIIKALHYMRLKEIVTVLAQANLLHREYPNKTIWKDIAEKEDRFKQSLQAVTPIPCENCDCEDVCAFFNEIHKAQAIETLSLQAVTRNNTKCNSCGRFHIEITDNSTNIIN